MRPCGCLHAADSVAEVPTCRVSRHVPQAPRSVSDLEHIIGDFNRLNSVTKADLNIKLDAFIFKPNHTDLEERRTTT